LALKENLSNKSSDIVSDANSTTKYPTVKAIKDYVDANASPAAATIVDADATTKGKIKLVGDLAGTADAPTVPGLALKANMADVTTSLSLKANLASPTFTGTVSGIDKTMVGLTNVDNTTDADKPVSTATQTALNLKEDNANKSTTTSLGNSDVLFPTQNAVKTYVDTNLTSKADITSLATVAISGSYNDLSNKPTVPAIYSLPNASATSLGGIKVGSNLSIDSNGVLSGVSSYSLPTASSSELGGVKVGTGLTINNGVLSASTSGVPYIGATQAVDLGAYDLKVNGITVGRGNGNIGTNTATGKDALLSNNSFGNDNTAMGNQALYSNTFGRQNTAIGSSSLNSNISGIQNTAVGISSLEKNVGVSYNTAIGAEALRFTVDGESNTATGASALRANINGAYNSAFGRNALSKSTASFNNAAFGAEALADNLANGNTAYGAYTLQKNTTGYSNTAIGIGAMKFHISGNDNVAIGVNAGLFASNQTSGSNNTAVGAYAEFGAGNLSNATVIGSGATVAASNTIQLGNTAVSNVKTSGTITAGTVTYPNAHNSIAGQVLTTNASGVASWAQSSTRSWTDQPAVSTNQTTFTLSYAPPSSNKIWMFINGVRTNNNAYSVSGTTVTYIPANNGGYVITSSDRIQFDYTY
jgi:hypothetical protein